MPIRTTIIKVGAWDVPGVGKRYRYRVCSVGGRDWSIYKAKREPVVNTPEVIPKDEPVWTMAETGFKSKSSAVEYVEELAALEGVDPYADLLNNIDDGVDLTEDGI